MASELCVIPSLHDIEKSVLDLSNQVRLQSAFLTDLIEGVGEEEDGVGRVNEGMVLNEAESEKILDTISSLKEELEKFKLNLKNYQDVMKQSRNGHNDHEHDEPNDTLENNNKDKSKLDSDTIIAQPESHLEENEFHCSVHFTKTSEDCTSYQEHEDKCVSRDGICSPLSRLSLTHKDKDC